VAQAQSEIRDGMRIDWDVAIPIDDGVVLRADVFRPVAAGRVPAIVTYGPYAKGLAFQEGYRTAWDIMAKNHPDVTAGSSNKYQNWEVVDPEKWVPDGYACARVDSRGAGRSPGRIDHFSPRETQDFHDCIEWVARQDWCSGKVGINGISYYAMNAWTVTSRQPRHLAAICAWEGAADWYRDSTHHGGILSTFWANWYDMQVKSVQHGVGLHGPKSAVTGELVCGPETLSQSQLAANRCDFGDDILAHPLDDAWHQARSPRWDKVKVPFLSAANWGGQGLHPRGNFEAFLRAASRRKWLEAHGGTHWIEFYTDYGVALQKRFFDRFLKGAKNGWDKEPKVRLQVRHVDRFVERFENEWPIARTRWTKFHLRPDLTLGPKPARKKTVLAFAALGDGLTFRTDAFARATEITGPLAARLVVSSSSADADLFLVLRLFDPARKEVAFQGALDPHTPVAQGWLRASHRRLDRRLTRRWRPYHTHGRIEPLKPGRAVTLDVELWPTSVVVPPGYRLALSVRGRDYEHDGAPAYLSNMKNPMRGCGPFVHDDPRDRPPEVFGGRTTLHFGGASAPYLLLPVIPDKLPKRGKSRR